MYRMLTSFEIKGFHKGARKKCHITPSVCRSGVCLFVFIRGNGNFCPEPDNNQPEPDAKPKVSISISKLTNVKSKMPEPLEPDILVSVEHVLYLFNILLA